MDISLLDNFLLRRICKLLQINLCYRQQEKNNSKYASYMLNCWPIISIAFTVCVVSASWINVCWLFHIVSLLLV